MTASKEASPYAVEVINDDELQSVIVALSYTDTHNPARSLHARIAPDLGSNFYSFKVGEHELLHAEPEKLRERAHTGNFVLWPFPNRVRHKHYTYQGQEYSLSDVPRSPGDASLVHGLVYDRAWTYSEPTANAEGASVTTLVEINPDSPYYAGYPFPSSLALTYTLTSAGITIKYTVQNKGTQSLPYGFALHPYLKRLSGDEETLLTLPANQLMEADKELLPTGRLLDVNTVMYAQFDLNQPTPLGHLRLDHVYTDLPASREAHIDYRSLNLGLHITASEEFTHTVIYAPPKQPFFCLEHQTCSTDAVNLHYRGLQDIAHLLEVQPGAEDSGYLHYEIEHR